MVEVGTTGTDGGETVVDVVLGGVTTTGVSGTRHSPDTLIPAAVTTATKASETLIFRFPTRFATRPAALSPSRMLVRSDGACSVVIFRLWSSSIDSCLVRNLGDEITRGHDRPGTGGAPNAAGATHQASHDRAA